MHIEDTGSDLRGIMTLTMTYSFDVNKRLLGPSVAYEIRERSWMR